MRRADSDTPDSGAKEVLPARPRMTAAVNQGHAHHPPLDAGVPLEAGQAGRPFPFHRDGIRLAPGGDCEPPLVVSPGVPSGSNGE